MKTIRWLDPPLRRKAMLSSISDSSALFAISAAGSDPQPTCETIEAAVEVAIDVARRYGGRVWYTTDLKHFSEVLDDLGAPASEAGRKRFGDLAGLPQRVPLQRLDRPRLVEVQHEIELFAAAARGSSGSRRSRLRAGRGRRSRARAAAPASADASSRSVRSGSRNRGICRVVEQPLVAAGQRRPHVLAMRRAVPLRSPP